MVWVRCNVEKTSSGIETSAAPLSTVKSKVILSLISTGTTNVPPSNLNGIDSPQAVGNLKPHKASATSATLMSRVMTDRK
jgi:hypothetical protein